VRDLISAAFQTAGYVLLTGAAVWALMQYVP